MAARSANVARFASISGRDGKYEVPSIRSGWIARVSGSSPSRLFQSYRSYAREPRSTGACGLVHDSRRWKNGQRRNMPPGRGIGREDGVRRRRGAAASTTTWRPPGPLPMTTTG